MPHFLLKCFSVLLILFSCGFPPKEDNEEIDKKVEENKIEDSQFGGKTSRILFLGNSLTYYNNLPKLVEKEASTRGMIIKTDMIAHPNYALEDHWNDEEAQKKVSSEAYDYLVVQQGPSSQADGKQSLLEYGRKLKEVCNEKNTRLVFFMVWSSRRYYHTYPGVISNYANAAKSNEAIICPVGEVWKEHFDKTKDFSYYGTDGFHPSLKGSREAARIIVDTLYK